MIVSYKCNNSECPQKGKPVSLIQAVMVGDGSIRICGNCREPMIVAETVNTSGRTDTSRYQRPKRLTGRRKTRR